MKSLAVVRYLLWMGLSMAIPAPAAERIDINTASIEELDEVLVNIGPAKAQAIVEYRQANGPFRSAEALVEVPGIGPATVERNRDLIEVGAGVAPARKGPARGRQRPARR